MSRVDRLRFRAASDVKNGSRDLVLLRCGEPTDSFYGSVEELGHKARIEVRLARRKG
jgi:hypothetical protein